MNPKISKNKTNKSLNLNSFKTNCFPIYKVSIKKNNKFKIKNLFHASTAQRLVGSNSPLRIPFSFTIRSAVHISDYLTNLVQ